MSLKSWFGLLSPLALAVSALFLDGGIGGLLLLAAPIPSVFFYVAVQAERQWKEYWVKKLLGRTLSVQVVGFLVAVATAGLVNSLTNYESGGYSQMIQEWTGGPAPLDWYVKLYLPAFTALMSLVIVQMWLGSRLIKHRKLATSEYV